MEQKFMLLGMSKTGFLADTMRTGDVYGCYRRYSKEGWSSQNLKKGVLINQEEGHSKTTTKTPNPETMTFLAPS